MLSRIHAAGRTRARAAIVVVALLAAAAAACIRDGAPLAPSDAPLQFTGTVSNLSGAPIAGAQLTVQSGPNKGTQVATDASGHYVFSGLGSGRFSISIDAPGFVSANPVVDLFTNLDVNFALRAAS